MRGTLVDRCDRCGTLLVRMTAGQHSAVEAVYDELAKQRDWPRGSGQYLTPWEWHQLMVAAYAREKGWNIKILPAVDGKGIDIVHRQKQSRLTKSQGSELIEFTKAWAIENGVELHEPQPREEEACPF